MQGISFFELCMGEVLPNKKNKYSKVIDITYPNSFEYIKHYIIGQGMNASLKQNKFLISFLIYSRKLNGNNSQILENILYRNKLKCVTYQVK